MNRYFIEIAYNGTNYHGWQLQENANSVQAEINKALGTLLQEDIHVVGAGRTDAGVHAKQLFAHFDTPKELDIEKITFKLNSFLPADITIQQVLKVANDMHARFNATARTYEYVITSVKNPFLTDTAYYFPHSLNIKLMNEAAKELLKHTDFSCFSKSKTDTKTNNCDITFAAWEKHGDKIIFTITANRFLRNMVRAIVGTLLAIGQEKLTLAELKKIINSKNRSNAGTSAPANGLFLTKVAYPSLPKTLRRRDF